MSLYRRGNVYWIKIAGAGQAPIRESSGTTDRKAAQEYHDRRSAEIWRVRSLGERPRVALADAIAEWLTTHARTKKSFEDDRLRVKAMLPYLPDVDLRQLTTTKLTVLHDKIMAGRGCAPVTANRYLEIISAVLHYGKRRDWIESVPTIPYARVRRTEKPFLTPTQAHAMLAALPPHLNRMARFALATGLRDANVRLMKWERINLSARAAWIPGRESKSGKPIPVPLTADAIAVLRECQGDHPEFVFVFRGEPIAKRSNNTAFRKARAAAGLHWLTWHTLRHTWASWHTMRGTPTAALTQLGGWSSRAMVDEVYGHLAPGFSAQWAENSILLGTIQGTDDQQVSEYSVGEPRNMGWLMGLEPTTTGITTPGKVLEFPKDQSVTENSDTNVTPAKRIA